MKMIKSRYLLLLLATFICTQIFSQANSTFGVFKDWGSTETRVFGMVKLTDTVGREFDRISYIDSCTIKIEEYNPAGAFINSTLIHFSNNHNSAEEFFNQWGLLYRRIVFTPDSNHTYRVTDKRFGVNDILPCKEAKYVYKNDLLSEIQYISFAGKLCNNINGIADVKYLYYEDTDRYGRVKEVSYFDEEGLPTYSKGTDYHRMTYDRDKHGNILSTEYYDEEGHKLKNRVGTFNVKNVYDSTDNKIESIYCGPNGVIEKNIVGVAKTVFEYKNGLKMAFILYDDKSNIVKASDTGSGIAITRYKYNSDGFVTSRSFYDEKNNSMNDQNGIHNYSYKYNTRDMLIEEEYFDKNELPAVDKDNMHRYQYGRDNKGREVSISFFGLDNQPVKSRIDKVYMKKFNYSPNDLLESESFWKNEDTKMQNWSGVHRNVLSYNEQGLQTELTTTDENGKLIVGTNGYSVLKKKYDTNARLSEYSRFDGSRPSLATHTLISNYHSVKLTYDDKNRVTQIAYLDTNENPTNAKIELQGGFQCYKIELKYVANRLTEEWFYPTNVSFPTKTIDCLKNDFVDPQGSIFGRKNRK